MRKRPVNWRPWARRIGVPMAIISIVVTVGWLLSLFRSFCRNCEVEPASYKEIAVWAEGGWTTAYPELKKAIEEANSDGKISRCEFGDLKALRERCSYEDARNHMMRTIENPPKREKESKDST